MQVEQVSVNKPKGCNILIAAYSDVLEVAKRNSNHFFQDGKLVGKGTFIQRCHVLLQQSSKGKFCITVR
jgi:hypothetical protein